MANVPSNTLNKTDKTKKRVLTSIWLIMALLSGVAALALWIFSSAPAFNQTNVAEENSKNEEEVSSNIGKITSIDELNELESMVHPISFDALVRDLRDYPPEFKDAKFFKKHKGEWTVQVMDVSEHDIITDYLNSREDRDKFAYFRYRDEDNQARYLLTYSTMRSPQLAMGTAKAIDFDLPANIQVLPEEIDTYLDLIENYELSPPVKDLSTNKVRKVKLQPTQRELEARATTNARKQRNQSSQADEQNGSRNSSANGLGQTLADNPIKDSKDTSDVLSVQEQRQVEQQRQNSGNTGNNANQSNSNRSDNESSSQVNRQDANKQDKPKVAIPVKPEGLKPAPAEKSNPSNNSTNTNNAAPENDVDQIRKLIEEQSQ